MTAGGGYLLRLRRHRLDARQFEALVATGRAEVSRDPAAAAATLRTALALWRGPALAGLTGSTLQAAASTWDEQRMICLEGCLRIELDLGRHGQVAAELASLVAQNPFRESLVGLLMVALDRAGRRSEALDAYHRLRRHLADELGIDPGPEVRRIHQAVLRVDAASGQPVDPRANDGGEPAPAARPLVTPAQLPGDVAAFAGRDWQLRQLDGLLSRDGDSDATAVVISAIAGTAGIGKTALAVHWAHRVADQFPDGQLYVNLRGFHPTGSVLGPAAAVRGFLDALGVPSPQVPATVEAQAGLYRSLLAGKRVLVLLDNARNAEQVRPLLPDAPGCVAVVTSRNQLGGLVAAGGAYPLTLDLLATEEARDLLARRLGANRVAAEPRAVEAIITRCARLALALAVVAARAAIHPRLSLAAVADQLHADSGDLDAFADADADPATDLRSVFCWSYQQLTADAAQLFRRLGLHPGPDISAAAAASLAGLPRSQVRVPLAELVSAHLLVEHAPGRYAFHDLLRAYATELAHTNDTDSDRRTATHRILDHYLHTAYAADRLLEPQRDAITLTGPVPGVARIDLADHDQALGWFTAEHLVLLAVVELAAAAGFDRHVCQLAWTLVDFLERRGRWQDYATIQHAALTAAQRLADQRAQARAHGYLAVAYPRLGRSDHAYDHARHALEIYRQLDDRTGQAHVHLQLLASCELQGRHAEALDHAQQALQNFQATGHPRGQANALNAVGWCHAQLGHYAEALTTCRQAPPPSTNSATGGGKPPPGTASATPTTSSATTTRPSPATSAPSTSSAPSATASGRPPPSSTSATRTTPPAIATPLRTPGNTP